MDAENSETQQTLGSTLPANSPAPNEAALAGERAATLREAVRNLPEEMREAIMLCEWQ